MEKWPQLGSVPPVALAGARIQLHYGCWLLGSVADSILEPCADDSQSNFDYEPASGRFVTRPLGAAVDLTCTLGVADLRLSLRSEGVDVSGFSLPGSTFDTALHQIGEALAGYLDLSGPPKRREYPDFPSSPLASGAPFVDDDREERAEIGRYFAAARATLMALVATTADMSEPRTWPHHFDIASALPLGEGSLVGLGMSPGDTSFGEPYFYAYPYPYPYPTADALPAWSGPGRWHLEGFTALVLTATELGESAVPADTATAFMTRALEACRGLVS